jgi:CheY-like chemotaxis protein/bifunctional DNA-binding transcriptional regulator/antitoxin component of YhaV-PrlF toxin-antitoxin module
LRFNKPIKAVYNDSNALTFVGKLIAEKDGDKDKNDDYSLVAIDTLKVDNRSRLTLTKEVKDILPVKPGDILGVYQDKGNSDIILRVQRESRVVDALRITKERTQTASAETERIFVQTDSGRSVDKVRELSAPHYYLDDPQKRYLPNIVLIDDDQDILVTFGSFLSSEGFNVKIFSKSNEAIEYLISSPHEYRVVITDIRMPEVNGLELYQRIKSANANLKIMFVTALDAADELLSIFSDVKKDDIIRKPIERDQFVRKVKNAIFSCLSFFTFLISGLNSGSTSEVFSQCIAML